MSEVVIEKVTKKEKGYMFVTKGNPEDETYLDLVKIKGGRKKKEEN